MTDALAVAALYLRLITANVSRVIYNR